MPGNDHRAAFLDLVVRDRDVDDAVQRVDDTVDGSAPLGIDQRIHRGGEHIPGGDDIRPPEKDDAVAVGMRGGLVQVETRSALDQIEAIASVDGIDGVFIGPNDLAASFGHIGNWGHPEVQAALEDAVRRLKKIGKPAGILTPNEEEAKRFIQWGYTFVAVGADLGLLARGADALAGRFKG